MSQGATVTVEGLNRFVSTLKRAGVDLDDMKEANAKVGNIVAGAAESRAPRRSGKLAASIRSARQARRARVVAGRASVPYAGPIHWGWPARNITAQPFLTEAARATESQWFPEYVKDVQRIIDKVEGV